MNKKIMMMVSLFVLLSSFISPVIALERFETPTYNISFFAYDCFNMQNKYGVKSGYGYEMLENLKNYFQGTFQYVGYELSANECIQLLDQGKIDLYTAAKKTPDREKNYIFSKHPTITSTTCMTVKVGNNKIIPGDYSSYQGIKVGLLQRHTYNPKFLKYAKSKGFHCEIVYYKTPEELTAALIKGEVDALVNSYIGMPEDEKVIETLEETPYYFMTTLDKIELMNQVDDAIDVMNIEMPNWRTILYNRYYGAPDNKTTLNNQEIAYLNQIKNTDLKVTFNPFCNPYSYIENNKPQGIIIELFEEMMKELGLNYHYVIPSSQEQYLQYLQDDTIDICLDLTNQQTYPQYKTTSSYLNTTLSFLQKNDYSGKINTIGLVNSNIFIQEFISQHYPNAKTVFFKDEKEAKKQLLSRNVDALLMMTYSAEKIAQNEPFNQLRVDIVPNASQNFYMGINKNCSYLLQGILNKSINQVAKNDVNTIVQTYIEVTTTPNVIHYLILHPGILVFFILSLSFCLFFIVLFIMQSRSKKKQEKIAQELSVALEKSNEASKLKKDFFSKMSHDIRTPLNVVLGMSQIAKKYEHDPVRLQKTLDSIYFEGNYLLSLINSILDVNQLEYGTLLLQEESFDIVECFNKSIKMLTPLSQRKSLTLKISCDLKNEQVIGDGSRLSQIMINIISNAIKYTQKEGTIHITLEKSNPNLYRFICQDNGIGMSKEFISHICEEYVRAEDSRTSKVEGTGLGMSVVKGFTELMGGTLKIESELHQGSTFIVEIPLKQVKQTTSVPQKDENFFLGRHVLLAEDNELNAEIVMELMTQLGLEVDWAKNGQECVNMALTQNQYHYDVIFMDIQMPLLNGIEATKLLRKKACSIPIIALTANTFSSDREACQQAGMNGFISKPVHIKDIMNNLIKITNS